MTEEELCKSVENGSSDNGDPSAIDARFVEAMEAYLEQLDASRPVDLQHFAERFPEIAPQLNSCFESLKFIRQIGPRLTQTLANDASTASDVPVLEELGDFRILREIGRGGMGVVYEAEQRSLGRAVALKVLPLAGMLDNRQLQRFRNEARAAAGLDHPHIVHVHAVGSDRGVHFYAMQLIEGRSLAEVICELRNEDNRLNGEKNANRCDTNAIAVENVKIPTGRNLARQPVRDEFVAEDALPNTEQQAIHTKAVATLSTVRSRNKREFYRAVARLGIQAADALEFAHQMGIVHRDIKPSNLLLDDQGDLWVTDFGLATTQAESGLTLTGDVVGTLRYMSPEQASGKGAVVDHRTDIYSLGVTLYELLTLRPALVGNSRQELLRQLDERSPKLPRRIDSAIPQDLETIVLKAIAKDSSQRYQTAHELAEDMSRFLELKPIEARRIRRSERTWRWMRRNPAVATLTGTVLLLLLFMAIAGPFVAWRQMQLASSIRESESWLLDRDRLLRLQIYDARMTAAHAALKEGDAEQVDHLLRSVIPHTRDLEDLRGWEWGYLWKESRRATAAPLISTDVSISGVAYSPNGKYVAATNWYGQVHVFEAKTRGKVWTKDGHAFRASCVAFSHDGRLMATASADDGNVVLRDSATGDKLGEFKVARRGVKALAFSDDDRFLALGLDAHTVSNEYLVNGPNDVAVMRIVRDPESKPKVERAMTLDGCLGPVTSVSFSCDGRLLAAACNDSQIRLWTIPSGEPLPPLDGHGGGVRCIAFSPNRSNLLASCGREYQATSPGGEAKLWNATTGTLLTSFGGRERDLIALSFSRDGWQIATGSSGGRINVWRLDRSADRLRIRLVDNITAHAAPVNDLSFSSDNETLVSCSADNSIRFWKLGQSLDRGEISAHDAAVIDLDFDSNGRLLASSGHDGTVRIWDLETGDEFAKFQAEALQVMSVDFAPDGTALALASGHFPHFDITELSVWDTVSRTKVQTLVKGPGMIWSARYSPRGGMIAAGLDGRRANAAPEPGQLVVWDTETWERVQEIEIQPSPHIRRLAWSADETRIATSTLGADCRPLQLWELQSATYETIFANPDRAIIASLAFSSDGARLAAGSQDGWIGLWTIPFDGSPDSAERKLVGHRGYVWYLDFSGDGRRLVSVGADQTARIWNVDTGTELMKLRVDDGGWLWSAKFSPDDSILAVGGNSSRGKASIYLFRALSVDKVRPYELPGRNGP